MTNSGQQLEEQSLCFLERVPALLRRFQRLETLIWEHAPSSIRLQVSPLFIGSTHTIPLPMSSVQSSIQDHTTCPHSKPKLSFFHYKRPCVPHNLITKADFDQMDCMCLHEKPFKARRALTSVGL